MLSRSHSLLSFLFFFFFFFSLSFSTSIHPSFMTSIINIGDISSSENESLCPSLTFKQRLYGAGGCLVLGFIFFHFELGVRVSAGLRLLRCPLYDWQSHQYLRLPVSLWTGETD
ncbi:hypothetical protein AGDE_06557 [Angomonas deanei]|nr:hypothetical protein AGDE_06557 [Angomonas deanei]|eukprot:EPY37377.1 hypothetical protein AGDE_06557 [Angomonas deanei]